MDFDSRQPRDLFKNEPSDSPKKSQLTFSQGMLKRGDDDEVSSSVPTQNCVTATLSTEELSSGLSIYSSPLVSVERYGGGGAGKR